MKEPTEPVKPTEQKVKPTEPVEPTEQNVEPVEPTEQQKTDLLENVLTEDEQDRINALNEYKQNLALEAQQIKESITNKAESDFKKTIQRIKSLTAIDSILPGCTVVFTHNYNNPFSMEGIELDVGSTPVKVTKDNIKAINSIISSRAYSNDPNISHKIK